MDRLTIEVANKGFYRRSRRGKLHYVPPHKFRRDAGEITTRLLRALRSAERMGCKLRHVDLAERLGAPWRSIAVLRCRLRKRGLLPRSDLLRPC